MKTDYFNFPFILGKCWCGCGTDLPIKKPDRNELRKYVLNHKNRGKFGKDSAGYKTGITEDKSRGYATIIRRGHKYRDNRNRVYLHRYLKELDLGYYLTPEYDVDHIDKNTRNNTPENLRVLLKSDHTIYHKTLDMSDRRCVTCNRKYEELSKIHRRHWYKNKTTCFYCYLKESKKIKKVI